MTTIKTTNGNTFNIKTKEAGVSAYIKAAQVREELQAKLDTQDNKMSDLCQTLLAQFGTEDAETGKRSLQLDLGDGSPRGHIVVQRGNLYFIRERNSGRPVGSKNKNKAVTAAVEAQPEVVVEEPSVVTETAVEEASTETSTLSPMEQALAIAEQEIAEQESPASSDPTADAIMTVATSAIEALKEHSRNSAAPASAAE